jgi:predicted amidohydrolase YtcJ
MGIQAGVMRWLPLSVMGGAPAPGDVLWPAERVTVRQMIRSYSLNGAYANFLEKTTGSIKVGKSADMVVLARDILKCAPAKIGTGNKVVLTLFRGKQVFRDKSF